MTSCLALQDMPGVPPVLRAAREAPVPSGRLVVSIAHPCTDTPFRRWEKDTNGAKRWLWRGILSWGTVHGSRTSCCSTSSVGRTLATVDRQQIAELSGCRLTDAYCGL